MKINADFSQRIVMHFDETDWVASPAAGVERKMLDRIGEEVARATTIVRFAPGSAFDAHTHGGGEEYLVLDGVFQDETGDFGVGSYVRNPPTSHHTPAAMAGATILVKLHQMHADDRTQVNATLTGAQGRQDLHADAYEQVWVETLAPGASLDVDASGGAEVFVLAGSLSDAQDTLSKWDWMRAPQGEHVTGTAGAEGATLWIKTGHLASEAARGGLV